VRPLGGVRVLAIEQYGAGPFGSLHLADLGAEVIKIEDPATGGDVGRYVPPFQEGETSLFFETFNRNKRSIALDLAVASDREVFEDLVRVSDVVYSNLRGDVPERMGIRYAELRHLNPAIVCCSLSGFGLTGPRYDQPAYDHIIQAMAGWMALTGEPDGPPTKSGLSVVDYAGGLVAVASILAGLHAARRDGTGMDCDVSLFETALSMLTYPATWYLTEGLELGRTHHSAHPSVVPFQAFPTADGWIVVACPKEKFWPRLAGAVGLAHLAEDERFATFEGRRANASILLGLLEERFLSRPAAAWLDELRGAQVPCGPVSSLPEALADPQTRARSMIVETDHPLFGTVRQVASPLRVGDNRGGHRRAPTLDEDRDYVLGEVLGYRPGRVAGLGRASGGS
jgi:crotonobetainyl-CoA:carnitine CoA-transferase CaiB-like acyl-CoA transferase